MAAVLPVSQHAAGAVGAATSAVPATSTPSSRQVGYDEAPPGLQWHGRFAGDELSGGSWSATGS
jgi:hypothetical protein